MATFDHDQSRLLHRAARRTAERASRPRVSKWTSPTAGRPALPANDENALPPVVNFLAVRFAAGVSLVSGKRA